MNYCQQRRRIISVFFYTNLKINKFVIVLIHIIKIFQHYYQKMLSLISNTAIIKNGLANYQTVYLFAIADKYTVCAMEWGCLKVW